MNHRLQSTIELTLLAVAGAALVVAGCGPDGDDGNKGGPKPFHESCTATVAPEENPEATTKALEKAFVGSDKGSVICIRDGTYQVKRELSLTKSNITIRGQSQKKTILDFAPQKEGANGILVQADKNFAALNFTIKNTASDSLKAKSVDGVVMKNITVTWDRGASTKNGAYALYPVESKNVLIEGCKVSYARDAGVYLGQSDTAIIRNNEAFGNVVGIEIENTFRAEAYDNNAHGNTDGFLIINLPDLKVKGGGKNLVYDNRIVENNRENFGEAGTAVANMPQGSGLVLLASNNNEIRDNTIKKNQSVGIGVVSYALISNTGSGDPKYDPYPEGNWVHGNTVVDNGSDPKGSAKVAAQSGDAAPQVFWDGRFDDKKDNKDGKLTNCFGSNVDGSDKEVEAELINVTEQCPDPPTDSEFCKIDCSGSQVERVELPDRVMKMAGTETSGTK